MQRGIAILWTLALLLIIGTAGAGASGELQGDQWVGHNPATGLWTMPDGRSF